MSMADDDRLRDDGQRWAEMGGERLDLFGVGGWGEQRGWQQGWQQSVTNRVPGPFHLRQG